MLRGLMEGSFSSGKIRRSRKERWRRKNMRSRGREKTTNSLAQKHYERSTERQKESRRAERGPSKKKKDERNRGKERCETLRLRYRGGVGEPKLKKNPGGEKSPRGRESKLSTPEKRNVTKKSPRRTCSRRQRREGKSRLKGDP